MESLIGLIFTILSALLTYAIGFAIGHKSGCESKIRYINSLQRYKEAADNLIKELKIENALQEEQIRLLKGEDDDTT